MVAVLDTPTDTQERDLATELQAARAKVAEYDAAIAEWEGRLATALVDAGDVERDAGDAVLNGMPTSEAGAQIAAARSAVAAAERALTAAKRAREQAYIDSETARAAHLRAEAAALEGVVAAQHTRIGKLWDELQAEYGFVYARWRSLEPQDLPGLLTQANHAETEARRRQAELDRQSRNH